MTVRRRLHPEDVQAIAQAVVALLREPAATAVPRLVDAAEVARRFDVGVEWVRENADRLGAVRLGDGPRPRLRFDPERVAAALSGREIGGRSGGEGSPAPAPIRRRRPTREVAGAPGLLPFNEFYSAESEKSGPGAAATARDQAERSKPSPRTDPTRRGQDSGAAGCAPRAESERSS